MFWCQEWLVSWKVYTSQERRCRVGTYERPPARRVSGATRRSRTSDLLITNASSKSRSAKKANNHAPFLIVAGITSKTLVLKHPQNTYFRSLKTEMVSVQCERGKRLWLDHREVRKFLQIYAALRFLVASGGWTVFRSAFLVFPNAVLTTISPIKYANTRIKNVSICHSDVQNIYPSRINKARKFRLTFRLTQKLFAACKYIDGYHHHNFVTPNVLRQVGYKTLRFINLLSGAERLDRGQHSSIYILCNPGWPIVTRII